MTSNSVSRNWLNQTAGGLQFPNSADAVFCPFSNKRHSTYISELPENHVVQVYDRGKRKKCQALPFMPHYNQHLLPKFTCGTYVHLEKKCIICVCVKWASLVAQRVKRLPAMQETQVWSLGGEDPLEKEMATHSSTLAWKRSPGKEMATHSSTLAWKISWTEKPGGLWSMGSHVWLFATLWTLARQAPLSMGFSGQEYWSGLPFPSPGALPNSRDWPGLLHC